MGRTGRRRFARAAALLAVGVVAASCSSGGGSHAAPPGVTPSNSVATSTTVKAPTTTTAPDPAPARAALDAYLAALAAHDVKALLAHSEGAAAGLGGFRVLVTQVDGAAGATTKTEVQDASFQPQSIKPTEVVFAGTARLANDVHGPGRSQQSVSPIDGPITVRRVKDVWRVKDFVYDSKPMVYEAELATKSQGKVKLRVGFVLSYANFTTTVVGLNGAKKDLKLTLKSASLTSPAGTVGSTGSGFTTAAQPMGFVVFPRIDAIPNRLTATFQKADGSTVTFVVPLTAKPS